MYDGWSSRRVVCQPINRTGLKDKILDLLTGGSFKGASVVIVHGESQFWLVEDNRIIGEVQIRHKMDELSQGNQVYWNLNPTKRNKVYEDRLHQLIQEKVRELGLNVSV